MIRFLDVMLCLFGLLLLTPVLLITTVLGYMDTGSPIFVQKRIGRNRRPFMLLKFRTMELNTSNVPTHLADVSAVTKLGKFLRKTKLDELPQLWNVLKGEMSLVGPRPCLPNQYELIEERNTRGVFLYRPGITGLAQINGIDMSNPKLLAQIDAEMLSSLGLRTYFAIVFATVGGSGLGDKLRKD